MLFNVDNDIGSRITGYLVIDSVSNSGSVRISAEGREIAVIEAKETLPALVAAGRHETGRCGFVIDESTLPNLGLLTQLEIHDADTGLLIYRRVPGDRFVVGRMVRLETHLVPLRRIDRIVRQQFAYAYCKAERLGAESMAQMFHLMQPKSLYIAARFLYKSFESHMDEQFKLICMIHDPFEELAERLLLFRRAARSGLLDARDRLIFRDTIPFAAGLPLESDRQMRREFSRLPYQAAMPLNNPLVRQLTVANIHDLPRGGAVTGALDALATCAIVGLRTEADRFSLALSGLLSAATDIVPTAPRCTAAMALADRLRQLPTIHDLLELDIEVYRRVTEASERAAVGLSPAGGTR